MLNVANIDFIRQRYTKLNAYYGAKGIAPQPSIIRIEENLVNGKGNYEFNLKKENLSGVENGLKRNDFFQVVSLGIATRIENEDKPDVAVPNFSPLIGVGAEASGSITLLSPGFATEDIKALYNGSLYISTGTTVNITDMPLALFLKQQSDDVTKTSTSGAAFAPYAIRSKEFNFENDLMTMAPELYFAGTQDHVVKVSFPAYGTANYSALNATSSGTPTTKYVSKIVFLAYGYRVIGGTSQTYKDDLENPFRNVI